jgi:hypothetical protein
VLVGCMGQQYAYMQRDGAEKPLPPVNAVVVSHAEAAPYGQAVPLAIPFATGRDGTQLVTEFLAQADARRAHHIADLAVFIQTRHDEQLVECRSDVVPESVTVSAWTPPTSRLVPMTHPVTQLTTEWVYQCRPVTTSQLRSHTETEQQCSTVSRPVQRSRTTYSTSYNSLTHSTTSVPHTEYYTEYQSSYECRSVPVTRMRNEMVTENKCGSEPQTRMVTRHEFQLEHQYVPGHFETFTRQRLHELEPVCYTIDPTGPGATPQNRIEGSLYVAAGHER